MRVTCQYRDFLVVGSNSQVKGITDTTHKWLVRMITPNPNAPALAGRGRNPCCRRGSDQATTTPPAALGPVGVSATGSPRGRPATTGIRHLDLPTHAAIESRRVLTETVFLRLSNYAVRSLPRPGHVRWPAKKRNPYPVPDHLRVNSVPGFLVS